MSREPVLVVPARGRATASIIFLHGLGADAHDFENLGGMLDLTGCRYLFPNAPVRPVTLNGGYPMRAWFDIEAIPRLLESEPSGLRESFATLEWLLGHEVEAGMPAHRILVGGFSQGGAVALAWGSQYPDPLLGLVGLSTFLPTSLAASRRAQSIFLAHGRQDPLVPLALAEKTRDELLRLGHEVAWQAYPMQHEVVIEEIEALRAWILDRLKSCP